MKVSLNSLNGYNKISRDTAKSESLASKPQTTRNFDGITIHANTTNSPEQTFQSHLTQKLSMEVRQPVSTQKLDELKQQVEQGKYEIDALTIADKILLRV